VIFVSEEVRNEMAELVLYDSCPTSPCTSTFTLSGFEVGDFTVPTEYISQHECHSKVACEIMTVTSKG
jgi:hypothetical protein